MSQTLPTKCHHQRVPCCAAAAVTPSWQLQRCWIPNESGALKAQFYLEQVTLQQTGPSEGDFSFLTQGSVKGGECWGDETETQKALGSGK